ncbi:hypothetical protein G5714_011032 [Onychostoma macrolepis]|uniref:Uncharacterized protein n=1 Tax=Onychostoma macrolepis TaxID=369639 RepID=A0A7J6CP64_9TELE|nr:hypothetical protein G5714_011032 [Onychostoma macrolepis]
MRTQRADHCPRPSARTGPTTKEWSEAESGSPSLCVLGCKQTDKRKVAHFHCSYNEQISCASSLGFGQELTEYGG